MIFSISVKADERERLLVSIDSVFIESVNWHILPDPPATCMTFEECFGNKGKMITDTCSIKEIWNYLATYKKALGDQPRKMRINIRCICKVDNKGNIHWVTLVPDKGNCQECIWKRELIIFDMLCGNS